MASDNQDRPATSADIEAVRAELERLRVVVADLSNRLPSVPLRPTGFSGETPASCRPEELVTLDQIGAIVHRSKRSMERYLVQMPAPRVRGRRGQP